MKELTDQLLKNVTAEDSFISLEGTPNEMLGPVLRTLGQIATTTTSYEQQDHADLKNFEEIQFHRLELLKTQYMELASLCIQSINNIDTNMIDEQAELAYSEAEQ